MRWREWGGFAVGLMLVVSACTPSDREPTSTEADVPRLEINKPDVFWADPKVVQSCDDALGQTTLHWKVDQVRKVAVHVSKPDGALFAMSGPTGSADTGHWVRDNMIFYLVNPDTDEVLASCTVRVTSAGCPEDDTESPAPDASNDPDQ